MKPVFLTYFDESGNTGLDLADTTQPVFLLGALICQAEQWAAVDAALRAELAAFFPDADLDQFEIHAHKLVSGTQPFRRYGQAHCLDFQKNWFAVAARHRLAFFYRPIEKKRFAAWLLTTYGPGVHVNPHAMAFPLLSLVVNEYLGQQPGQPLGMFISDENQEISDDLEKSVRLLRGGAGRLKLDHLIEKCFFIDSQKSLLLQLCDVCCYAARKHEESNLGYAVRQHHLDAWLQLEPLVRKGDESLSEVIAWMTEQIKKRPGTESRVS
jgi:hypothetical protein